MTERDALLRAVCDTPDDDTPRLVFADWLQENGEEARAEFIRVQCELASSLAPGPMRSALISRALGLLRSNETRWRAELRTSETLRWGRFERGFVDSLTVYDLGLFKREAETLITSAPLTCIEFAWLQDPGALSDVPALSRMRYLSIHTRWPSAESVRRLAGATNLSALEGLAVLGPTMDFALEDLLAERFGVKFHRGM